MTGKLFDRCILVANFLRGLTNVGIGVRGFATTGPAIARAIAAAASSLGLAGSPGFPVDVADFNNVGAVGAGSSAGAGISAGAVDNVVAAAIMACPVDAAGGVGVPDVCTAVEGAPDSGIATAVEFTVDVVAPTVTLAIAGATATGAVFSLALKAPGTTRLFAARSVEVASAVIEAAAARTASGTTSGLSTFGRWIGHLLDEGISSGTLRFTSSIISSATEV